MHQAVGNEIRQARNLSDIESVISSCIEKTGQSIEAILSDLLGTFNGSDESVARWLIEIYHKPDFSIRKRWIELLGMLMPRIDVPVDLWVDLLASSGFRDAPQDEKTEIARAYVGHLEGDSDALVDSLGLFEERSEFFGDVLVRLVKLGSQSLQSEVISQIRRFVISKRPEARKSSIVAAYILSDDGLDLPGYLLREIYGRVKLEENPVVVGEILEFLYSTGRRDASFFASLEEGLRSILASSDDKAIAQSALVFARRGRAMDKRDFEVWKDLFLSDDFLSTSQYWPIDHGLSQALKGGSGLDAMELLERLLISGSYAMNDFTGCTDYLARNPGIVSGVVTRWLLEGPVELRVSTAGLVEVADLETLQVDRERCKRLGWPDRIYLARKAIGWLFAYPEAATDFIVSILEESNGQPPDQSANLLFDILLVNYGELVAHRISSARHRLKAGAKRELDALLTDFYEHVDEVSKIGPINELRPSAHMMAVSRYVQRRTAKEIQRDAENNSLLSSIATKVHVLNGDAVVSYLRAADDQSGKRSVTNLQTMSFSTTVAGGIAFNLIVLEHKLFVLRNE